MRFMQENPGLNPDSGLAFQGFLITQLMLKMIVHRLQKMSQLAQGRSIGLSCGYPEPSWAAEQWSLPCYTVIVHRPQDLGSSDVHRLCVNAQIIFNSY